tara:strand:- start:2041 stop:2517 length:477 start_codon:yes stop_codon:yes gene_type:complete
MFVNYIFISAFASMLLLGSAVTGVYAQVAQGTSVPLAETGTSDPLAETGTSDPLAETGTWPNNRGQGGAGVSIQNPLQAKSITEFFFQIIEILLIFAIPIIVFFIILAGFRFVTAQGDTNKLSDAKRALLYAIVGGLLILGAYIILEVIESTVNAFRV